MAPNSSNAVYRVAGKILDGQKIHKYCILCFTPDGEYKKMAYTRAQTAVLVARGQVENMRGRLTKEGVEFIGHLVNLDKLPVYGNVAQKNIPDSAKYKIVAILKDGKHTVGYRVRKPNGTYANLHTDAIYSIFKNNLLLNATVKIQFEGTPRQQYKIEGLNFDLSTLPKYTPNSRIVDDVTRKDMGDNDALLNGIATEAEPPVNSQTIHEGQADEFTIYSYFGKIEPLSTPESIHKIDQVLSLKRFRAKIVYVILNKSDYCNQIATKINNGKPPQLDESDFLQDMYHGGTTITTNDLTYATVVISLKAVGKPPKYAYLKGLNGISNIEKLVNYNNLMKYFSTLDRRKLGGIKVVNSDSVLTQKSDIMKVLGGTLESLRDKSKMKKVMVLGDAPEEAVADGNHGEAARFPEITKETIEALANILAPRAKAMSGQIASHTGLTIGKPQKKTTEQGISMIVTYLKKDTPEISVEYSILFSSPNMMQLLFKKCLKYKVRTQDTVASYRVALNQTVLPPNLLQWLSEPTQG